MEFPVLDSKGKKVSTVELPAEIFEATINIGLMHQAFVRQMANARQGTHKTKSRGEVRMTTAKWYRQKGTGRARHGARSAPIFVGGGVAHGPRPRSYVKDMPKKMRRGAIRSALSALVRDEQLIIIDKLELDAPKTKDMKKMLEMLVGAQSALVVLPLGNYNVAKSLNNLPNASALWANYLNIRDLLKYDKVVVSLDALEVIQSIWGQEG
ncbi:50S ribosomal protein L4 [Anaerolineales bacterium]|jgi:large subunit ribosomal protein L4